MGFSCSRWNSQINRRARFVECTRWINDGGYSRALLSVAVDPGVWEESGFGGVADPKRKVYHAAVFAAHMSSYLYDDDDAERACVKGV